MEIEAQFYKGGSKSVYMTIQEMKETTFKEATLTEWEQAAIKSLKGKSLESLSTKTLEDIILKPLYSLADSKDIPEIQTTIIRQAKNNANWLVSQVTTGATSA